ncbi:MAG: endonuclease III [Deltaproteobacteria bacterium]|nr:endonuclease III [Deltaproteobacteria bacterium]
MAKTHRPPRPRSTSAPRSTKSEAARVRGLLDGLSKLYPDATTALRHAGAFELLAATILSAQCTDERVNRVTPALFARVPDAAALAAAPAPVLEGLIRSTGFYHNKAKSLLGMSQTLVARFKGEVPRTMEELVTLPGVARKTANVVLGTAYGIAAGVVVDTHVRRLAQRLGLSTADDPEKIERDLMALVPRARWIEIGHTLILHGRRVCAARAPACDRCTLRPLCPTGRGAAG